MEKRRVSAIVGWGCGLALCCASPAFALTDGEAQKILEILHPDAQSLAKLQKEFPAFRKHAIQISPSTPAAKLQGRPEAKNITTAAAAASGSTPPPNTKNVSPCAGLHFILRNDWSDLGYLGCPQDVKKAKGASIAFTQDYVANNKNWAAQGMAAAIYSDITAYTPGVTGGLFDRSFAIYAQANSSYNSSSKLGSKNLDTRTFGLSGELGWASTNGDLQFLRVSPSIVQDAIKGTTAVAAMGEYIPAVGIFWDVRGLFGGSLNYQIDPIIKLQYASTTDPKNPLAFSERPQSLRIGPELTLLVQPFAQGGDLLQRFGMMVTYHPWYEAYSNQVTSYWWSNSLTYRIDDNGNLGLAFSYNRGLDENSGAPIDQFIASINGKY